MLHRNMRGRDFAVTALTLAMVLTLAGCGSSDYLQPQLSMSPTYSEDTPGEPMTTHDEFYDGGIFDPAPFALDKGRNTY